MGSVSQNGHLDKPRRVALYARVSTEDQAERQTIQGQCEFLRSFVGLYGLTVAGEYLDDGVSGTVALADRTEGRRLLDDVPGGRIDEVLVYRLDRLGRTLRSLIDAHDRLASMGVTIRSATEPFDTSTPIGKFLFQLLASLAELERSTISERMGLGRDRVAKLGKWTGGPIPLGYDLDSAGTLVPSSRLVPTLNITEAELARSIFTRIASGSSATSESLRLNLAGVPCSRRYAPNKKNRIPTPTPDTRPRSVRQATRIIRSTEGTEVVGSGLWGDSRILGMIHSPLYYTGVHVLKSRSGIVERPATPLVSAEVWQRANDQLTLNKKRAKRNAQHFYPLRGLIMCGCCGKSYVGSTASPAGYQQYYYRCWSSRDARKPTSERCRAPAIRADRIERAIWSDCVWFIEHPEEAIEEAQRQLRDRMAQSTNHEEQRRLLLQQIAEKGTERERVMTLFRRGRASLDDTERQLDDIAREEGQLRGMLEAIRAQETVAATLEQHVTNAATLLARFRSRLDEIERADDWHARREIIECLVVGIKIITTSEGKGRRLVIAPTYAYRSPDSHRSIVVDNSTS
jgi:site-specific DNA recombinase